MRIEQVPPALVRQAWGFVRPEAEKLLRRFGDDWIPEDLYRDLTHEPPKATLFLMLEEKPVGYFVVELVTDKRSLRRYLNVWLLAGRNQLKQKDQVIAYLDRLAKDSGCSEIEYRTSRKGWIRALKNHFEVKTYVLTRKV